MIRITGGNLRSRKLETPDTINTKPTMDRVREGVFNALQNDIYQATVLDLFAGSGAYGFESLSRGAKFVVFVDKESLPIKAIKKNQETLLIDKNSTLMINEDYKDALNDLKDKKFDLIFVDPPYIQKDAYDYVIKFIEDNDLLNNNGVLILESEEELHFESKQYFRFIKQYKYSYAKITILRK